jgi:hypothetical protein
MDVKFLLIFKFVYIYAKPVGETPQAFTPRMLTARPAESEHL